MTKRKKGPAKRSWIVTVTATVSMVLVTEDMTEEEARTDPFAGAVEERVEEMRDYEVTSVEPNE